MIFPPIQEPGLQQLGFLSSLLAFPVTSCQVRAISAYGPGQWSFAYGTQMYPAGDGELGYARLRFTGYDRWLQVRPFQNVVQQTGAAASHPGGQRCLD